MFHLHSHQRKLSDNGLSARGRFQSACRAAAHLVCFSRRGWLRLCCSVLQAVGGLPTASSAFAHPDEADFAIGRGFPTRPTSCPFIIKLRATPSVVPGPLGNHCSRRYCRLSLRRIPPRYS